jgi:formylglycine-generating enzyme required for sulfatase activity
MITAVMEATEVWLQKQIGIDAKTRASILTPADMIRVPSGKFIMGASPKEQEMILQFGWSPNWIDRVKPLVESSGPPHEVYLDSFYIFKHEVTNRQYKAFVDATGHTPPEIWSRASFNHPDQPVVCVSWNDANAFCTWAGMRLPTEAEWEKAARGSEGLAYPWGNAWDASKLRSANSIANRPLETFNVWSSWQRTMFSVHGSEASPARVGSYPEGASPYGVMDMAGNVWEWVADWYDPHYYAESPERNPKGPPTGQRRVLRGGGWDVPKSVTYTWYRETFMPPHDKRTVTGFRCASSERIQSQKPQAFDPSGE